MHHKWQLVSFAKNEIRALLKDDSHLNAFLALQPQLSPKLNERLEVFLTEIY